MAQDIQGGRGERRPRRAPTPTPAASAPAAISGRRRRARRVRTAPAARSPRPDTRRSARHRSAASAGDRSQAARAGDPSASSPLWTAAPPTSSPVIWWRPVNSSTRIPRRRWSTPAPPGRVPAGSPRSARPSASPPTTAATGRRRSPNSARPAGWAASHRCSPLIADCERGVGRPERAIELARSPEAAAAHRRRRRRTAHRRGRRPVGSGSASTRPSRSCPRRNSIRREPGRPPPGCSTRTPRRCWRSAATEEALQWFINAAARRRRGRHRRRRADHGAVLT